MEVTALCIQTWMNVFILLAAQHEDGYSAQKADAAFLRISPERLQFFLYESVSLHCEGTGGDPGWKVVRKLQKTSPAASPETCDATAPSCSIYPTLVSLSGKYWCENEAGEKSDAVNVSVTDGSVILVIPTQPVMEGSDVILHCLEKENNSERIVDFYKDSHHFDTGYYSQKTIENVSKSDEGLYSCSVSGSGESPESWLAVFKPASDEDTSLHGNTSKFLILTCTVLVATLLVAGTGLLLLQKLKVWKKHTETDSAFATYAVVQKPKKRDVGGDEDNPDSVMYAAGTKKKKVWKKHTETDSAFATYAVVQKPKTRDVGGDEDNPDSVMYAAGTKKKKDAVLPIVNMEPCSEAEPIYTFINEVQD